MSWVLIAVGFLLGVVVVKKMLKTLIFIILLLAILAIFEFRVELLIRLFFEIWKDYGGQFLEFLGLL